MQRALLIAALTLATCDKEPQTVAVDPQEVLAHAESMLATSGWSLRPEDETAPAPPNWSGAGHVAYRQFGTRPGTGTRVRVYAFADAAAAKASEGSARAALLDGLRSEVIVRDRFVFIVETPVLPGNHGPPGQNAAFRALTRAAMGE